MSYINVYPSRINWENEPSIASPINATNLNKIDYAVYEHDRTFSTWDITKANQSDLLLSLKDVSYNTDTGVFVFTWWNGTTQTVDLNIEKIPVSFSMSPQGVITMTTDDGTTYTADVGSLIKTYAFNDSSVIDFTVTTDADGNKTVTADIVDGSITGQKLQPNYLADCEAAKTDAENAADAAEDSSEDAEAWAVGERGGVPVPSTDPAYENSAKYWAQHTSSSLAGLTDTDITNPQNGDVLSYNSTSSKWENGAPTAGGGSKVVVTTSEVSLQGENVTLTDGVTTLTSTFDNNGVATFEGVTLTGNLTLTSTDGAQTSTRTLNIPYFGNYTATMAFFSATITVTYPANATCTLSDGVTTLVATGSPMAFNVSNTGTWTATATIDGVSKNGTPISITTDGQTASDTIEFGTINLTYDNEFRGESITCVNGGTTITKTAPLSGNTMTFYPSVTGTWTISGTYSGQTYTSTATVSSLSTPVSAILQTVPDGSTVTPVNDIQTWLACAGINDKSYTTLAEVLADSTTLLALMSDNNAVDYLVRSDSWSGGANVGLVPILSGTSTNVLYDSQGSGNEAWKAFDNVGNTFWASTKTSGAWIGYDFGHSVYISQIELTQAYSVRATKIKIQASSDKSTWVDMSDELTLTKHDQVETLSFTPKSNNSYRYWRMYIVTANATTALVALQFYAKSGCADNQNAMTAIGANNYCANTLLANSTWCSAICNSTYFESVLNVKVPTMTSDNTPSGVCSATSVYGDSFKAYKAFDGDDVSYWTSIGANATVYYQFTQNVKVYIVKYKGYSVGNTNENMQLVNGDSNDSVIQFLGGANVASLQTFFVSNPPSIRKYGLNSNGVFGAGAINQIALTLQFYGRKDV